jgi:hypothetical protein
VRGYVDADDDDEMRILHKVVDERENGCATKNKNEKKNNSKNKY